MRRESMQWQHDHVFGQDEQKPGETRTLIVIAITATMMVVEIVTGIIFGSMALLADGLHMGSHATALGIAAFAYIYARKKARDDRFNFGTGKVNSLAGFAGAVLLAAFTLPMAGESIHRLFKPVPIAFDPAIAVAIAGLVVNGFCALILGHAHGHGRHDHRHGEGAHGGDHHHHEQKHEDHNLRSAYLHVLADALTSVLAIFALFGGKLYGWGWMDPAMGILGALLVARWSWGLVRLTTKVLLDEQGPRDIRERIRTEIEAHDDNKVAEIHLWAVGPASYAVILSVVTGEPKSPQHYKDLLPHDFSLVHVTVEVHPRD